MTAIHDEHTTLNTADGGRMQAFASRPASGGCRGGILVLQEAFGVNEHIRELARRFARSGYAAIAPELYHRSAPGADFPYSDLDAARAELAKLTDTGLEHDLKAAHHWLSENVGLAPEQIASAGFCMGGYVSFLANTVLPLACAVSFYGGRIPSLLDRTGRLSGPLLLIWGGRDSSIDADQRQQTVHALQAAGKPFTHVLFSDAGHGFFCDQRRSYDDAAAAQAWPLTLAFLDQHLR